MITLEDAIQEFEDNAFHPSMKSNISDEAKAIALKCMYDKLHSLIISGEGANLIWDGSRKSKTEESKIGARMFVEKFEDKLPSDKNNHVYILGKQKPNMIEPTLSSERLEELSRELDKYLK